MTEILLPSSSIKNEEKSHTGGAELMLRILATNAFWSLLSHLLSRGSLMVAAIILARSLNTQDFVTYSYFQLTVSMLAAYASMGMGVTASRFFAEFGANPSNPTQVPLGTLWFLSLMVALMAGLLVFLLPDGVLDAGLGVPRWLMALGVFVLVLNVVPGGAILGLEQYKKATAISVISGMIAVAGAYWAASKESSSLAMLTLTGAFLTQSVGQAVIVIRHVGWDRVAKTVHFRMVEIGKVFNVAFPMLMVTLMAASGTWVLGRIILSGKGGETAFAYYSIGLQWFALALLLPGMLARVAMPMMVRSAVTADQRHAQGVTRLAALLSVGAGGLMAACAVAVGPWLISIYGDSYSAAGRWFIASFMLAGLVLAPINTMGNAIIAHDGQWQWLGVTVFWFFVLIVIGFAAQGFGYWTGSLTLTGAALAMAVAAAGFARLRGFI